MNNRLMPIFALVIAALAFFVYVRPTWIRTIADTKSAIALDDQALAAAADYTQQQNALAQSRAAIDPTNLDRLAKFLPDSVDNVGLILDLNGLAARAGLSLSNIDVVVDAQNALREHGTLPTGPDPIGNVSISLSAIGTYNALQTFLQGIEQSARLLDVQDLVVKGSDTGVYSYQVNLKLYWLR